MRRNAILVAMALDLRALPPPSSLVRLAEAFGVRRFALFGSALRDDFTAESDIDILVEYRPGTRTGLRFFALQEELEKLFGRKVDLNTAECLPRQFRSEVVAEARELYVAA